MLCFYSSITNSYFHLKCEMSPIISVLVFLFDFFSVFCYESAVIKCFLVLHVPNHIRSNFDFPWFSFAKRMNSFKFPEVCPASCETVHEKSPILTASSHFRSCCQITQAKHNEMYAFSFVRQMFCIFVLFPRQFPANKLSVCITFKIMLSFQL